MPSSIVPVVSCQPDEYAYTDNQPSDEPPVGPHQSLELSTQVTYLHYILSRLNLSDGEYEFLSHLLSSLCDY